MQVRLGTSGPKVLTSLSIISLRESHSALPNHTASELRTPNHCTKRQKSLRRSSTLSSFVGPGLRCSHEHAFASSTQPLRASTHACIRISPTCQRRTFLDSLLSSALGSCPLRQLTHTKKLQGLSSKAVFKAISDVSGYPSFVPFTISSEVTSRRPRWPSYSSTTKDWLR